MWLVRIGEAVRLSEERKGKFSAVYFYWLTWDEHVDSIRSLSYWLTWDEHVDSIRSLGQAL